MPTLRKAVVLVGCQRMTWLVVGIRVEHHVAVMMPQVEARLVLVILALLGIVSVAERAKHYLCCRLVIGLVEPMRQAGSVEQWTWYQTPIMLSVAAFRDSATPQRRESCASMEEAIMDRVNVATTCRLAS